VLDPNVLISAVLSSTGAPAQVLSHWRAAFHGWNAANFGWGADRTQNILWRLEHGELDGVDPKVIVLLAGTNNVGAQPRDEQTIAEIARGVKAIVALCRQKAPQATIILTAIFPRNDNVAVMPTIDRINEKLAALAYGQRIRFLNINDRLADASGMLADLKVKGYTIVTREPKQNCYIARDQDGHFVEFHVP